MWTEGKEERDKGEGEKIDGKEDGGERQRERETIDGEGGDG